jgi:hypothetical protein
MTLASDFRDLGNKVVELADNVERLVTSNADKDAQLAKANADLQGAFLKATALQSEFDAYKLAHPATLPPPVVDPGPAGNPPSKIKSIVAGFDGNGARIDIETTAQVLTYGHDKWTSPVMPATQRKFDLTYLPYGADIPVKITFADNSVETKTVHTNPKA